MKAALSLLFIGIFLTVFVSCNRKRMVPISPHQYEMRVMKIGKIWKVVDATDSTKTKLQVRRKDTIVWTIEGTDAFFQFPDSLFNPVDKQSILQNGFTKFLRNGHKLKLKIKDNAPSGIYSYAVFCTADSMFAQGDSPPRIIVK